MEVEVKQAEGMVFLGKSESGSWVPVDHTEQDGPMELVLVALGSCSGVTLVQLMEKMRLDYEDIKVKISAERREEHPQVFTEIDMNFRIFGDLPEEKVEKAVKKSVEKYCSLGGMLQSTAEINHNFEIIRE